MPKPLLHKTTEQELGHIVAGKHHAIALQGPYGAGKGFVAGWLASQMLGRDTPKPGQIKHLTPVDNSIGIDAIRDIQAFLRLKSTGKAGTRRVVIIEDAHAMTVEAQNALLKALEEPPEDTRVILTIAGERALLPTMYSRLQSVRIFPVTEDELNHYFKSRYTEPAIRKAHAISGGHVGLSSLLLADQEHELTSAIEQAKALIGQPIYERLLEADRLSKDKEAARLLLFALKRVLSAVLAQAGAHGAKRQTEKLVNSLKTVYAAESSLTRNPNMKLTLTDVMLNL